MSLRDANCDFVSYRASVAVECSALCSTSEFIRVAYARVPAVIRTVHRMQPHVRCNVSIDN